MRLIAKWLWCKTLGRALYEGKIEYRGNKMQPLDNVFIFLVISGASENNCFDHVSFLVSPTLFTAPVP